MLKSSARAFLTILLVGVLAGSAVAFAVGGGVSPHKTICIHPIPGSSYQICVQTKPINVKDITLTAVNLKGLHKGHLNFSFRNRNKVPVKIRVLIVIKTTAGKIERFTKTITLAPGHLFSFHRSLKKTHVRAAKLTLTVTDTNGDHAIITRTFGHFG